MTMAMNVLTEQQRVILNYYNSSLQPKPKVTGSDWCNQHFYLSPESSSMAGKMTLHAYQEEIVDAMCDEWTELVVLEKSSRIGYNKLLNVAIAYFIVQDPATILFYSPNDQLSKDIAVTEIEPMVRDNPPVGERIRPNVQTSKRRKLVDNTMLKSFAGGYLQMLGAMTPNNFAQRTARVIIVDELSRWLDNIGGEGDGVSLARVRASDFYNGKVIVGSSPTHTFRNKIGQTYEETDMRIRHLPCPFCEHYQPLLWKNLKFERADDEDKTLIEASVGFECVRCQELIRQRFHKQMDNAGKWVKQKPHVKRAAGFKIWTAYGFSPKMTWIGIVKQFLKVKDNPLKLQAFTNTVLGESWDDATDTTDPLTLFAKRERYHDTYDLPEEVLLITAGVDTQNDRLEMMIVGHGKDKERWILDYHVIYGDPAEDEVWVDLERFYNELSYTHPLAPDGIGVYAMSIDSGGGRTKYVYDFCKPRLHLRIYPIKGASNVDAKEVNRREAYTKTASKYKITHFHLGVTKMKDYLVVGLAKQHAGANYIHLPDTDWADENFCAGLVAEYKDVESGRWLPKEEGAVRNEPIDTLTYAESAKLICGVDMDKLAREHHHILKEQQRIKTEERLSGGAPMGHERVEVSGDAY